MVLATVAWTAVVAVPGRALASDFSPGTIAFAAPDPTPAPPGVTVTTQTQAGPGTSTVTTMVMGPAAVPAAMPPPAAAPAPATPAPGSSVQLAGPAPTPRIGNSTPLFDRIPYASDDGYVQRVIIGNERAHDRRFIAARVSLDTGSAGKSTSETTLGARLDVWRLSFDAAFSAVNRMQMHGTSFFGNANASFSLLMRPKLIWRLGGGLAYLSGGHKLGIAGAPNGTALGPGVTTSFDAFPAKPVVISGQADYSRFGFGSARPLDMVHGRATVGMMTSVGLELYVGFDFRRIGNSNLYGPLVGARFWF